MIILLGVIAIPTNKKSPGFEGYYFGYYRKCVRKAHKIMQMHRLTRIYCLFLTYGVIGIKFE